MTFHQKLTKTIDVNDSLLCIGLDPVIDKLPQEVKKTNDPIFEFNKQIIDQTHDLVSCYKPNIAFYESSHNLESLQKTVDYIHKEYPTIPVICDAKRGDIASTSVHYAQAIFDELKADAITVSPYLGFDSLEPFLKYEDKGVFILCRTSNPSAQDFQDMMIEGEPLFLKVAKKVATWSNTYRNCAMVVGATWPEQLRQVREIVPQMELLVPGVGSQGGDLDGTLKAGLRKDKAGLIINSSRSIIYAGSDQDFTQKARNEAKKMRDKINTFRN